MQYSDTEIRNLITNEVETPNLDYKVTAIWDKGHNGDRLEITKDILAMANTRDGGKIVIGVDDKTKKYVGLSDEAYNSFEITKVNQFIHNYADPVFTCNVIKKSDFDGKKVVIIDVPEFQEVPIICKENGHDPQNNLVLVKGGLYIRTAKCTSELVSSADEMRSILGRGLSKKSDELLASIQKLMIGKPLHEDANSEEKYETEIKEAEVFFGEKLDTIAGSWEVIAYPTRYNPATIQSPIEAGNIVSKSAVRLRGWDFPHSDYHGNMSNFSKGRQSFTVSETVHEAEAWRMYKSGLFIWKELLREDISNYYERYKQPVLSFVGIIYSVTEFMLFLKRVYTEKLDTDTVHIKILLNKCKNRRLVADYPGLFDTWDISNEEIIIAEKDIQSVSLQASFEQIARDFIREIFMMFNWNDPDESMIESWQKKLIEKGG